LADQKGVDAAIIASIKKTKGMKGYLNSSFALSKGQFPHAMKF
jgi:large subunit ribosomal protein L6e